MERAFHWQNYRDDHKATVTLRKNLEPVEGRAAAVNAGTEGIAKCLRRWSPGKRRLGLQTCEAAEMISIGVVGDPYSHKNLWVSKIDPRFGYVPESLKHLWDSVVANGRE